jgi:hypothetical protein
MVWRAVLVISSIGLRGLVGAGILCSGVALGNAPGTPATDLLTFADQQELRSVSKSVVEAILGENVQALLRHVSQTKGLTCTDTEYSYRSVEAFLRDKKSHLYISLFDTGSFSRRCGDDYPVQYPAISEREFLRSAEQQFSVTADDVDWAHVTISSPVKGHYTRAWYLHREGGTWKLTGGSFVIGRCSCG